jgi:predicted PurR-regulated permease PerM
MDEKRFYKVSLGIILLFLSGVLLKLAKPVLFPLFLALFLSYAISPLLDFLMRLKIHKSLAIVILLVLTFFCLYLMGALFYSSGKSFAAEFPLYGEKINALLRDLESEFPFLRDKLNLTSLLEFFNAEKIASLVLASLGPFLSFFSNLLLIFVFLVFILAGRGRLGGKIQKSFGKDDAGRLLSVLTHINKQTQKYIAIKTVVSLMNGLAVGIILLLFGVDFAVVFGFLAFLLNYIPNFGSFIATLFPVLLAFLQFGTIWVPFWILIILVALDAVLGNFVEPRLMGKGLGLSPLLVLFSLLFWGWLWGLPGMILAVPILAVIKIICANVPSLRAVEVLMD